MGWPFAASSAESALITSRSTPRFRNILINFVATVATVVTSS
jgi:hypothetical protein